MGLLNAYIQSKSKIVRRLHKWRLANQLGRRRAARELTEKMGVPVRDRTMEGWEQGRWEPNPAMAHLLDAFLREVGF